MKLIPNIAPIFVLFALLQGLFAPTAFGQLDLPDRPKKSKGDNGVDLRGKPRGDIVRDARGHVDTTGLRLPPSTAAPAKEGSPEVVEAGADHILSAVKGTRGLDDLVVTEATEALLAMGYAGMASAREGLGEKDPAIFIISVRALLRGGVASDRELVFERIRKTVPGRAASQLVRALVESTPEEGEMDLLIELCENRQGGVRRHAARDLAQRNLDLGRLLGLAESSRSEARELAYQMMADIDDPTIGVEELLLKGLGDTSTRVAVAACTGISIRLRDGHQPLVDDLMDLARLRGMDDRKGAYALLALVEAEDRLGGALIPASETVNLQMHMRSGQAFISAVSAAALAGIGFRSEQPAAWLDQGVPHALVTSVAGDLYFPEYSAVRPSLLRRLEMISGQRFGDEGPLWRSWWSSNAAGFEALRAVLPATLDQHGSLDVRWSEPLEAVSFRLLGESASAEGVPFPGVSLRMSAAESEAVMQLLLETGALGAGRLPGLIGTATGVERSFEVRIGAGSKAFRFGSGADTAWVDGLIQRLKLIRHGADWQLYPGREFGLTGGLAFYAAESTWWAEHPESQQREERLSMLIVDNLRLYSPLERRPGIEALMRLPNQAIRSESFDALLGLLGQEDFFGAQARQLLSLAIVAGKDGADQLGDGVAGRLMDVVFAKAGSDRGEHLITVLQDTSPDFRRGAALDPRSVVRAVAAAALARGALEPEDLALLRALMQDASSEVEAAAVFAVSAAGLGEFRGEVQARARIAEMDIRRAAIRGVGRMAGPGALDVLRLAVLDKELSIKLAGAEALADLADPMSTTLLTQMLATGDKGPFFSAAKRGLLRIGEPAWDSLLVLARTEMSPAQRPAMLMLARQAVAEVAPILMTTLTEDPGDTLIARELAVLSGVDYRESASPSNDWWVWHDLVRGDNAAGWFARAYNGMVEQGRDQSLAEGGVVLVGSQLAGDGSLEGALSLVELLRVGAPGHMSIRARRDLERMVGSSIGSLPAKGRLRDQWCDVLVDKLPAVFAMGVVAGPDLGK